MKSIGETAHWIDKGGHFRSQAILPHHLKGNATYRSEALHLSDCAEDLILIPIGRENELVYIQSLEQLKQKSA